MGKHLKRDPDAPTRQCRKCLEEKGRDEYYAATKNRLASYCKACHRKIALNYARTPERRGIRLQRQFGMSLHEYDALLMDQQYRCRICGILNDEYKRSLAVDHDHATGAIRGLLCTACNTGLGYFKDNTDLLEAAIQYLKGSKSQISFDPQRPES